MSATYSIVQSHIQGPYTVQTMVNQYCGAELNADCHVASCDSWFCGNPCHAHTLETSQRNKKQFYGKHPAVRSLQTFQYLDVFLLHAIISAAGSGVWIYLPADVKQPDLS